MVRPLKKKSTEKSTVSLSIFVPFQGLEEPREKGCDSPCSHFKMEVEAQYKKLSHGVPWPLMQMARIPVAREIIGGFDSKRSLMKSLKPWT